MARTFRQRFEDARGRVARLNRGEMGSHQLEGPGSEQRLAKVRAGFKAVSMPRSRRPIDKARVGMALWLIVWATCVGIVAAIVIHAAGDRPPLEGLQHVAAYPNCSAARLVGAAPANVGEPGYWPSHDRDGDGVSCEPIPDWVER